MHEYYRQAIHFILQKVDPLPTGAELADAKVLAETEVNDWSV